MNSSAIGEEISMSSTHENIAGNKGPLGGAVSGQSIKTWFLAIRPATLPLSVAATGLGNILAWQAGGAFSATTTVLILLTAVLLQIISNLANDYGDFAHGADDADRVGPARAVATGSVSAGGMMKALVFLIVATIASGLSLLFHVINGEGHDASLLLWILFGGASIVAALAYTMGSKPYGYLGFGDASVLTFFGYMAVLGSYYLQAGDLPLSIILPATVMGLWCVVILNINNMRDRAQDIKHGKMTLAVRLGKKGSLAYHSILLLAAWILWCVHAFLEYSLASAILLALCALAPSIAHWRKVRNCVDLKAFNGELRNFSLNILAQTACALAIPFLLG